MFVSPEGKSVSGQLSAFSLKKTKEIKPDY
jgi:hypothetical protein